MTDRDFAIDLIGRCEADLFRPLTDGERRDLLMDQTDWTSDQVAAIVATIPH